MNSKSLRNLIFTLHRYLGLAIALVVIIFIRNLLIGFTSFLSRQNIVAQGSQPLHNWQWKLLVCVQSCHRSDSFIILNGDFNFIRKRLSTGPSIPQIVSRKLRKSLENLSIASTQATVVHQSPNRNARSGDTGITANSPRSLFDPALSVAETLGQKLNGLSLLRWSEGQQLWFQVFERHRLPANEIKLFQVYPSHFQSQQLRRAHHEL